MKKKTKVFLILGLKLVPIYDSFSLLLITLKIFAFS